MFAHLVYVCAFAPVSGSSTAEYITSPEGEGEQVLGLLSADPAVVGALCIDTGDRDAPAGIPTEAITVTADRYGTVPHTYVLCTKDNAVPPALQRRFVREIDAVSNTPTQVAEFDSSHSPFLSQPATLADVIAGVSQTGLPTRGTFVLLCPR
ncbi:MAG: hypothetical protein JWQ81_7014 [Amycolatopsis sp.]|uniref:alpha/beta fold hydrolase n=1 Tax=Amycolatopsis sp. TaxID=37632 RepID=UPI002637C451|nr:alpha/beta fold hydrolase [Amycolatopsis sp.]MCU1686275.1 hypothetical protein [Amycolatopsis sp.]